MRLPAIDGTTREMQQAGMRRNQDKCDIHPNNAPIWQDRGGLPFQILAQTPT
jgi:hypothetical protein